MNGQEGGGGKVRAPLVLLVPGCPPEGRWGRRANMYDVCVMCVCVCNSVDIYLFFWWREKARKRIGGRRGGGPAF